jgi:hypothetical protein
MRWCLAIGVPYFVPARCLHFLDLAISDNPETRIAKANPSATVIWTKSRGELAMAKTVADLVIERLIGWGVKTIFSLPGDGINGMFEALRTHREKLKYVQVRHEEAAAFAACGYGRMHGDLWAGGNPSVEWAL